MRALNGVDAGSFTVVMATGILGVGARLDSIGPLPDVLLALACLVWLVLAAVLRTRAVRSFALVAGTAVIGADLVLAGEGGLALAVWGFAVALWLAVAATIRGEASGSLLTIVATESLAVLAASLDRQHEAALRWPALCFWALGLILYPLIAGPLVRRSLQERRFEPTLWIAMGALAITTLAAAELVRDGHALGVDVGLATWAAASAAIPLLVVAEIRTRRWRYEVTRWSFVFPLGMYGVASRVLGTAGGPEPLRHVGTVFFALGLAAWVLTAARPTLHFTALHFTALARRRG